MTCNYPVDPKVVPGGVTAVAHYLVKGLAALSDIDLHVVCCQPDVLENRVEQRDGATIHFLTNRDRFSQLTDSRPQRRRIARVIRAIDPHLVHAQGLGLQTQAALDSGLPFVVALHGVIWRESTIRLPTLAERLRGKLRARSAYRQILATRNVFITSGYAAKVLPAQGSYREFVVNNPVGDRLFGIRNEPETPHVLVVGGMRERKDPMTTVRVMERVLRDVPDATMHLLGPPSHTPLDREVERFLGEKGLGDRVKILGLVPEDVLWDEYRRARLMLMTSLEETAPVAIGEAYAAGIPVVGTDAGGIPYLIRDGETGFVRPVRDVEALAGAVRELLTSADLRARFAAAAARLGRSDFSLEGIAGKTRDAYREILDR